MVSTAFLIKQDEREEVQANNRLQVDRLMQRLNPFEMETLHMLMSKAEGRDVSGNELTSATWSGDVSRFYDLHADGPKAEKAAQDEMAEEVLDNVIPAWRRTRKPLN